MNEPTIQERVAHARKHHDVTNNGVAFEWWLANCDGAGFLILREPHHTDEDIDRAKSLIKADRDVVGAIRVES
jgi:hypothetical protein